MSIQFHETVMGRRFIEGTMPELVRQLTRLNNLIERILNWPNVAPSKENDNG